MKIKGFLAILLLVVVLVYFIWIIKSGDEENIKEEVNAFSDMKFKLTEINMKTLGRAVTDFILSKGRLPNDLKEIQPFHIMPGADVDAWGKKIKYECLSEQNFRLVSAGMDGKFNTKDDIVLDF